MSTLRSANGRLSASPHTAKLTDSPLARVSSRAESKPKVVRSTPFSLASVLARHGMSPSPVPTSRSVAQRGRSLSVALISSRAALTPPKSALQRTTSASDRFTRFGSRSGRSRISTPRLRGGTRIAVIVLALQLRVPTAIVQQRLSVPGAAGLDLADDYRVVAGVVLR